MQSAGQSLGPDESCFFFVTLSLQQSPFFADSAAILNDLVEGVDSFPTCDPLSNLF